MSIEGIAVYTIFAVVSIVALSYVLRVTRLHEEPRDVRNRVLLNFALVTGVWELSVAAVIAQRGEWAFAMGPGMLGLAFVAARWGVPALKRRLS